MVARLLWEQDAAGSNPVTSTKLSLDANRIPDSAFYLSFCLRCFFIPSTQDTPHCKTGFTNDLAFSEWSERSPAALLSKDFPNAPSCREIWLYALQGKKTIKTRLKSHTSN